MVTSTGLDQSLRARLGHALPGHVNLIYNHVSTPPTKCDALFAPPSGRKAQRTYRESHLLAISSPSSRSPSPREPRFIFAIEVFIYTTNRRTTLFVSKADSTGCKLDHASASPVSPIRAAATAFVDWLVDQRQRPGVPLVVSLFARAQNQYLFPGSESNAGKHILDDRQLVRWWCKTLDPIAKRHNRSRPASSDLLRRPNPCQAYLIVPGFDQHETTHFFPDDWRSDPPDNNTWKYGHPLYEMSPYPGAAPRSVVPRFPDDPKTRYVEELDGELPDVASLHQTTSPSKRGNGLWKSVKTLDTFWDMMAFRQECRSGRLVGFVWLVVQPVGDATNQDSQSSQATGSQISDSSSSCLDLSRSQHSDVSRTDKSKSKSPLRGPILPRPPRVKQNGSVLSRTALETSSYYRWPSQSRGQVVLSQVDYDRLHELLLRLDFTSDEAAESSTAKFLDEVSSISGQQGEWGEAVQGVLPASNGRTGTQSTERVTDLSSSIVRKKKRKIDHEAAADTVVSTTPAQPIMLDAGLVRKKQKPADSV